MNPVERFNSDFRTLNGSAPAWLQQQREAALARFSAAGFPTTRHEEWKYTNVATLAKTEFASTAPFDERAAGKLLEHASLPSGAQLVFVHGIFAPKLSRSASDAGVDILSWDAALERDPDLLRSHFGKLSANGDDPFVALNQAMARDGALIRIRRGTVAAEPIHLIFLSPAASTPIASHPYVLIIAEENCAATVLETYVGADQGDYLTNAVTEVHAGANARLRHYRIQREGSAGFHLGTLRAHQQRDSQLSSVAVSLGARLSRTNIETILDGPGSECALDGLYLGNGRQHHDHHTSIDHQQPRSTSRELYKGILDGHATGVFNGKVFVRPHALKSDARQMNNNLLLSDDAEVDTKPQLEIFADDVKCSHGATIGRLDLNALFYLQARGIDAPTARNLLIYAFANELVGRIAVEPVRLQLATLLESRFGLPGAGAREQ